MSICFSMTRYATLAIWIAVRATRKTPAVIPMPIASQMRIATSTDTRSCSAGEPTLERRQPELAVCEAPRRGCRHVVGGGRSVDERREARADRRRQLCGIAEIRRYVGEVLDRILVVALSGVAPRHPVAI